MDLIVGGTVRLEILIDGGGVLLLVFVHESFGELETVARRLNASPTLFLSGGGEEELGVFGGGDSHETPEAGQSYLKIFFLGRGSKCLGRFLVAKKADSLQNG